MSCCNRTPLSHLRPALTRQHVLQHVLNLVPGLTGPHPPELLYPLPARSVISCSIRSGQVRSSRAPLTALFCCATRPSLYLMNRTTPRQRSPQPSDVVYQQIPATTSTQPAFSSSTPPTSHPRTFNPTPPYTTTNSANPYGKPGFFLTPQSSLSSLHLSTDMWLWKGTRSHYVGVLVLLVCCVVVFSFVTNMRHPLDLATVDAAGASFSTTKQQQWAGDGGDFDVHAALRPLVALHPTIASLSPLNVPTFYQRTNASLLAALASHPQLLSHLQDTDHPTAERVAEKGVVILLHGCTHDGSDWFTLPEERRIVRLLLASGYSALAFTSVDRGSGCWDSRWSADNVDVQRVIAALQAFIHAHYTDGSHPQLFIMGASSGGTFASVLARTIPTTAQCIIVSPGSDKALLTPTIHQAGRPYSEWSSAVLGTDGLYSVPPTAWLYMLKDTQWASEAKIATLRDSIQHKAKSLGHRIAKSAQGTLLLPVKQHPLTKSYMAERLDGWSVERETRLASMFYKLAHREGFVDRYDYLIDNPRQSGMARYMLDVMEREVEGGEEVRAVVRSEVASVGEELAVLWGEHEMTSEHMDEVVLWMERQRTRAAR